MALWTIVLGSIVGCRAPLAADQSVGIPAPPLRAQADDTVSGERRVLLDQLHQMAQQDANARRR
jgi:hypothetical protein